MAAEGVTVEQVAAGLRPLLEKPVESCCRRTASPPTAPHSNAPWPDLRDHLGDRSPALQVLDQVGFSCATARARSCCRSGRRPRPGSRSGRRGRSRPSRAPTGPRAASCGTSVGRAVGLEVVDADLARRVQVPARLGEERRHVAGRAVRLCRRTPPSPRSAAAASKLALRRASAPGWRAGRSAAPASFAVTRSGRAAACPRSRSARRPGTAPGRRAAGRRTCPCRASRFATNAFQYVTEPQPVQVWRLTPARPNAGGISVAAGLPSGRNALPSVELGVELARAPAREHLLDGRLVDAEQVGERLEVRRERDDRADVEIAVRPSRRGACRCRARTSRRRSNGRARTGCRSTGACRALIEEAGHADDRVQLEQRERRRRIVEVDLARLDLPPSASPGSASASTFSPTASAVFGLTPGPTPPFLAPAIAWCSCSASPQNASSPNVSKRKICRPCSKKLLVERLGLRE